MLLFVSKVSSDAGLYKKCSECEAAKGRKKNGSVEEEGIILRSG